MVMTDLRRKITHTIDDCPQAPTIATINEAIKRVDERGERMEAHGERTAIALEEIARQGVMVQNHERRIEKNETDIDNLGEKVRQIERRHDIDHGKEEVLGERKKFWTDVKVKLAGPMMGGVFFAFWLIDRFNVLQKTMKLWREMTGQ
jgi:hypothetical protein